MNHHPVKIDGFLNHIPRRARNGSHNRPLFSQETVQQAGLADIRAAKDDDARPFPQDPPLARRCLQFLNHRTGLFHDTHQLIAFKKGNIFVHKIDPRLHMAQHRQEGGPSLFHLTSEVAP